MLIYKYGIFIQSNSELRKQHDLSFNKKWASTEGELVPQIEHVFL